MCPSSCAEISPFFLIRQHHSGKRPLQNCTLYWHFYLEVRRDLGSWSLCQGHRQGGCWDLMTAGRSWGRGMSLGHSAAVMTVSKGVCLAHCSFTRWQHHQKLHDSDSGYPRPTIKSKSLLSCSSFLPASLACCIQTSIHHDLPAHSGGLTAWNTLPWGIWWVATLCRDSSSPPTHHPASHRAAPSFPAGQQLLSPT